MRSIEIPEPLFEAGVNPTWDREEDQDVYHCVVMVGGKFVVYEKTVRVPSMTKDEETVRDEFLAEFSAKFKQLMSA